MSLGKITLAVVVLSLCATATVSAQTIVGYKTGSKIHGRYKDCFYNVQGQIHSRTVFVFAFCPRSIQVEAGPRGIPKKPEPRAPRSTVAAFKTGERTLGSRKECTYEVRGSAYTRTISADENCPLTIQVESDG